jgi:two-component system sensor histidine kinase YesM
MIKTVWYSINTRLKICFIIAFSCVVAVILFSFVASYQASYDNAFSYFSAYEREITSRLLDDLAVYYYKAHRLGYYTDIQRYLLSNDPETVLNSLRPAQEFIEVMFENGGSYKNICLITANGRYISANNTNLNRIKKIIGQFEPIQGRETSYSSFILDNDDEKQFLFCVYTVNNILWSDRSHQILCVIDCDLHELTNIPVFSGINEKGAAVLMYDNSIISVNRKLSPEEHDALGRINLGHGNIRIGNEKYLTIKVILPDQPAQNSHWNFIYYTPLSTVYSLIFTMLNKGLPILSLVVLIMIIIFAWIIHTVNAGVVQLVEDINSLEYDQYNTLIMRTSRHYELELISNAIYTMIERIRDTAKREKEANEKLLEAVTSQAEAEFMSYRTQINPHFLFNILECMRSMAHSARETGTEKSDLELMIQAMSMMFRYSLYAKPMVSLSMELEHTRNYINVMNIRSDGKYRLMIHSSGCAGERQIPSMILQPIVENSISYGFSDPPHSNCVILIQAFTSPADEGPLIIRIADNGKGMEGGEEEGLKQNLAGSGKAKRHTALCNIYRRMKICFGPEFRFTIKNKPGFYFMIEMSVPLEMELAIPEIK